ncbi:thioesterase II family protein [Streptomyces albireticuli]|uniref:thioesterase II family protein n=1 Tax=Streptomyces albireticuli TaxID=1940 RepID=UPI000B4433A8|nr:alpha/beta fold hydrolase [Streptomyces albireticuli]
MKVALLCVPHAGAGASLFRKWQRHPLERIEVVPVQLPGREELFAEDALTSLTEVVDRCADRAREVPEDMPLALFGHSFGALVAHETAHRLVAEGARVPERLVVSGVAAPWLPRPVVGGEALADEPFVARVREVVGYDHPALHEPELRGLLLPSLRADLGISDRYTPGATGPLPVPITALRGAGDRLVSKEDLALWSKAGSSSTEVIELPGDHMYFAHDPRPLLAELDAAFARAAG